MKKLIIFSLFLSNLISNNDEIQIQKLMDHGVVHEVDKDGNNLLHIVAIKGIEKFIEPLVTKFHININSKNNDGLTPIYFALRSGLLNVLKTL